MKGLTPHFSLPFPGNTEPELTGSTYINASIGDTVELYFNATDDDGDGITMSATGLPPGSMFDASTGIFTWTISNTNTVNAVYVVKTIGPF